MRDRELAPAIERELALMSPGVRRSAARVDELLDPEFREIGMSGRLWTRTETMQALATEPADESCAVEVTDMQGTVLGPGLVLLTYVSSRNGRAARRSSVWRCSDGNWRLVLHQGTPIQVPLPTRDPAPFDPRSELAPGRKARGSCGDD